MERETIRIKYHCDELERLTYIDGKSDWIESACGGGGRLKKGRISIDLSWRIHAASQRI